MVLYVLASQEEKKNRLAYYALLCLVWPLGLLFAAVSFHLNFMESICNGTKPVIG